MRSAIALLIWVCLAGVCKGQGTLTINFNGHPPGYDTPLANYNEAGLHFYNPDGPENLIQAGGGVASEPDNGTSYLQVSAGAKLGFNFTTFPTTYFNLVSFDAAEYNTNFGAATLVVVGYKEMSGTVSNYFTLDGIDDGTGPLQDFETFHLDSSFVGLNRVDFLTDRFSLDNILISGVPEPSTAGLAVLGAIFAFGRRRGFKRR